MSDSPPHDLFRSPELLSRRESGLLVVDMQEKLLPAIPEAERLLWNIGRLLEAASLFSIPVLASEQYPRGLGPTHPRLAPRLPAIVPKLAFSACGETPLRERIEQLEVRQWVVTGIEAHVCVLQTAHDLLAAGYRVYLPVDAVGSRRAADAATALGRLEASGAVLLGVESALFEWCGTAADPHFKAISALVKQQPPA